MKRLSVVGALVLGLSVSTLAGDIPISGSPAPTPNGTTHLTSAAPGDIPTSDVADQLSSDALSALLSVLGFLAV